MRKIKLSTWPRERHFRYFNTFDYPHFSLCSQVDVTNLLSYIKRNKFSLTLSIAYLLARVANELVDFRYRIRGDEVVEHEIVHPSFTVLGDNDLFSFCSVGYSKDISEFVTEGSRQIALIKENPSLQDEPGHDDLLFMTAIPWVSFTGFMHPIHTHPIDSIPRFAWGKIYSETNKLKLPLSVQVHHGLMDGLHVGRYFAQLQDCINRIEDLQTQPTA
ncbi:MAG: chloramphenicol acetyltransferase [Proteobacteria bacterium]|nr:chloramphenicol acetyltransferase [Pseudomonadota bacterium]